MNKATKIKLGIYSLGLLMMGTIGISGGMAIIGAHFPNADQTMIQNLVSVPALFIIPTTLVTGKLAEKYSKRSLAIVGALLFLIGGVAPVFLNDLNTILVFRSIFGIGIGICQVISTAIVAANFTGEEQLKVQGTLQAFQMIGFAIMVFIGGALADIQWNLTFYIHLLAIVTIVMCLVMLQPEKPTTQSGDAKQKTKLTSATAMWVVVMLIYFISNIMFSISLAFFVEEFGLGGATESGLSLAFFAIGGTIMGLLFGKTAAITKNMAVGVGCMLTVIAYLVAMFAPNMGIMYLASFLYGIASSATMPAIFINTSISADAFSATMAVAAVTCAQNLGQSIAPYIINPIAESIRLRGSVNFTVFTIAMAISLVLGIVMLMWGLKKNRESVT